MIVAVTMGHDASPEAGCPSCIALEARLQQCAATGVHIMEHLQELLGRDGTNDLARLAVDYANGDLLGGAVEARLQTDSCETG